MAAPAGGAAAAGTDGWVDGPAPRETVGTDVGLSDGGVGFGWKSSSTGRGGVSGSGRGSNGTQPMSVNKTSGQASASPAVISLSPACTVKPTATRVGRPTIRAKAA